MFLHQHPYPPFIPPNTKKLIIGTIPPPRFSTGKLFEEDVDFCYGSKHNFLWKILSNIFDENFEYSNTQKAVDQRKAFLTQKQIGICDMVESCEREKMNASDLGMKNIKLRDLINILKKTPTIETIFFMGGNSKNSPEYFFRKHLNDSKLKLEPAENNSPKINQFILDIRVIKTISLISPSAAANRSIGANPLYKELKKQNSSFTTFDFRVMLYKKYFF
ncbi:MAG: uracil-DNA glycosylase family protein [Bacteroidota bacterium]